MINIYTDGSYDPSTGIGGWAALIEEPNKEPLCVSGQESAEQKNTNQRMEQLAIIKALKTTKVTAEITVYSDSQYVVYTMEKGWKRKANQDLWDQLDLLSEQRTICWRWIRGHAGNSYNEFVDAQANFQSGGRKTPPKYEDYILLNPIPGSISHPNEFPQVLPSNNLSDPSTTKLTHLDDSGKAMMVDVGQKGETSREAVAECEVLMQPATLDLIQKGNVEKGEVFSIARLAGIMGAKQTPYLIPLCHPIPLDQVTVEFSVDLKNSAIRVTSTAKAYSRTGLEMEAMVSATITGLTIYDMVKAVDRSTRITNVRLIRKKGGKSGEIILE
jgi:cyclic pyranopterin phosphate synthase